MKRVLAVLVVSFVIGGVTACSNSVSQSEQGKADETLEIAEYTSENINNELQIELAEGLTSLDIVGYEITLSDSKLDHEYKDGEEDYVFDYLIKVGDVELIAKGRGSISGNKARLSSSLAYIIRSEDNKIIWSSAPGFDIYNWETGELMGKS